MSEELLQKLSEPFPPKHISWLPGQTTKDKTKCMAMAYGDLRAYMNRLDEVCGLGWSVSYTPWSDKVICHLTINGVTRSSTGEPDSQSSKSEIGGTVAEAQAFKRACAMFGLGRYLYNLDSAWVEFDAQRQRLTDAAIKELDARYTKYYNAWLAKNKPGQPTNGAAHRQAPSVVQEAAEVAELAASVNATVTAPELANARKAFHATIADTFPKDDADPARHWFIEKYTTSYTPKNVRTSTNDLTADELDAMTAALKTKTKHYRDRWIVEKTAPIPAAKVAA